MALPYPDNLVFQYDARNTDSVTITDGKVSGLADLYNSYNLTQTNASLRPTLTTVDGVQCLQFGTGGAGQIHLLGSDLPLTGDATLIVKVRGNGVANFNLNGMFFKADSVGQCHFGGVEAVAGQWYESFGGAGTGFTNRALLNIDISSVSQGVWTTATIRRSGDTIYGGFDGTEGTGAGSIAGGWTSAYRIGQTTGNYHWNGYIAYMALYDRSLSAEEIAAVVAALESTTLSTGLQGWWCPSLDTSGNGTTTLTDLSGNGNNGTLTNMDAATDWVADTDNGGVRALDFDGIDDYVALPEQTFASDFAISLWVKPGQLGVNEYFVGHSGSLIHGLVIREGGFRFWIAQNQESFVASTSTGTWHHVAVVRSDGDVSLYWDGSASISNPITQNGTFLIDQIARFQESRWATCRVDGLAFWDRAITAAEVTQIYNGGRSFNLLSTGTTQSIVPQLLLRRRRLFGGLVI